MKKLFDNIIDGLSLKGWEDLGGALFYRILRKDEQNIKVYVDSYQNPTVISIRCYMEEKNEMV